MVGCVEEGVPYADRGQSMGRGSSDLPPSPTSNVITVRTMLSTHEHVLRRAPSNHGQTTAFPRLLRVYVTLYQVDKKRCIVGQGQGQGQGVA